MKYDVKVEFLVLIAQGFVLEIFVQLVQFLVFWILSYLSIRKNPIPPVCWCMGFLSLRAAFIRITRDSDSFPQNAGDYTWIKSPFHFQSAQGFHTLSITWFISWDKALHDFYKIRDLNWTFCKSFAIAKVEVFVSKS